MTLQEQVKEYITENFGGRCDPPVKGDITCAICEVWKAYDTLFGWENEE